MPLPDVEISYVGEDDSDYFQLLYGRKVNILNTTYLLPADRDEVKRSQLHHRTLQYLFSGKNYVGPVKQVLQFGEQRRVLDMGTGSGAWAIDMADEFPRAEIIGIDLAPIQPRSVPPNCTFELCDLDQETIPYPPNYFDLIHARSIHTGIRAYPRLLREIHRMLRPGGLVLLIEPDLSPALDLKTLPNEEYPLPLGWQSLWETYRKCLKRQGIDVTVPQHLARHLASTQGFENIVQSKGSLPIGFWPTDPTMLTVGQLQWMDHDLFLPSLTPFLRTIGLSETNVRSLIAEAQQDLYYPPLNMMSTLHVVYATKRQ